MDALRDELGLEDEAMARRRWSGLAEDILDWGEGDGGGKAWEVAGSQAGARGVVLAEDGDRIYVAVATHGIGQRKDAQTRILALRKEKARNMGQWVMPRIQEQAMSRGR